MVGPGRPEFVMFGSSIVQYNFGDEGGWAGILAHTYARKADMLQRGYAGWNSRQAVDVLDKSFPNVQPDLVIVYFGGNDSALPNPTPSSHVPLDEYVENMRKIAIHLQSLSDNIRLIFLTAPPVNEAQALKELGVKNRKNKQCEIYADACVSLCQELDIMCNNLFTLIQQQDDWLETSFTDGIHFTSVASKIVADEILKVIAEADWIPSLHSESLPYEFLYTITADNIG